MLLLAGIEYFWVPSVMLEEFEMTTDLIEECQIGFIGVTVTAV